MSKTDAAPSIAEANKDIDQKSVDLSEVELQARSEDITLLTRMYNEREQKRVQFDDMTFSEWDDRNIKADISYIPPARNKGDTRIVTGTTREKDSTLLSTALSYEFQPNVVAYDLDDRIIDEIGEDMEDLIYKSRQIEDYESKRPLLYRGIISRGTYYAMEMKIERWNYDKDLPENYKKGTVSNVNWKERIKKVYEGCEVTELDSKKVLLGSMFLFRIQDQPSVAVVDILPYENAQTMFQDWERWQFVHKQRENLAPNSTGEENNSPWNQDFRLTESNKNEVERVILMKKGTNSMQIYLNGVPMLPVISMGKDKGGKHVVSGFPLTCVSPSGDYPIAKGDFEPVDGFAISKGQPAKMRVDQELLDESYKLMILGMKSSRFPAMANNSGRVLTRANFMPATITDDIRKDSVFRMNPDGVDGISNGEFSFFELIKAGMEEKSVTKQYEGTAQENVTATQILENKKQQMLKLGLAMDGITRFERDLAYLRLRNILVTYTKAQDRKIDEVRQQVTDIYRTFTVDKSKYGRGQKQKKVINFTKNVSKIKELDPQGFRLHEMEEKEREEKGVEVRYSYIDPDILRNLKAIWYVTVTPNDKKEDTLSRLIFVQNVREAAELFGPQSLNVEKLKQRYTAVIGEDFDTWFLSEIEVQNSMMDAQGLGTGGVKAPQARPNANPALKTALQVS